MEAHLAHHEDGKGRLREVAECKDIWIAETVEDNAANAAVIENALLYTLEQGTRTGDFGDRSKPALNTTEFADAIIGNFGKQPQVGAKNITENTPSTAAVCHLDKNPMLVSKEEGPGETIVGVDFFIESTEQPTKVAEKALRQTGDLFKLVTIANRGTQVWPKGSIYTNLVNQFNCRFESTNDAAVTQIDIVELYRRMATEFKVCSTEVLNMWGDKRSYSLAQGQCLTPWAPAR